MLGFMKRLLWSARKARLPVPGSSLVLDVGSGSCPLPRSDVLLDRLSLAQHRCGSALVADRPLVLGNAMRMPFRDGAFDFVVASHILEHMTAPEIFLEELQRVARAGLIEVPNACYEALHPYCIHCLAIVVFRGKLLIWKKRSRAELPLLERARPLYEKKQWYRFFKNNPALFHERFFWKGTIAYEVMNPQETCDWLAEVEHPPPAPIEGTYPGRGWHATGLRMLRRYYERRTKKDLDWLALLACPSCRRELLRCGSSFVCPSCGGKYPAEPLPDFSSTEGTA